MDSRMSRHSELPVAVPSPESGGPAESAGWMGQVRHVLHCLHLLAPHTAEPNRVEEGESVPGERFTVIFQQLAQDKTVLDQTAREIEERFLSMGSCVQELSALSTHLLSQSERLAVSTGTEFKTILQGAFEVIEKQLEFVAQYQEINTRLVNQLADYLEKFQKLSNCQEDLDRILTPMRTICVLFKIHSVSLENEERSFFESLTTEIAALQLQASAKFGEQMTGLLKTGEALSANIPHLREQSREQGEKVRQKKASIEASMNTLQQQFEQMQTSHERLSQVGKELKTASGGAVLGLQYQDITRQKWEHVAEAIQEMSLKVGATVPSHEILIFLRDVSRIQIRQVTAIQDDLSQAQSTVGTSVRDMLEKLRAMDEECQRTCGKSEGSAAVESMVKELLEALSEARVWVGELSSMAQTTSNAVSSFDKTASDVSGTLRRLSASIGMVALNAQVQVARIGHENGLDVLSEFICVSSTAIKSFSETVGAELDGLVGELHETIVECRNVEEKTREEQRWLEEQGRQQEEQLHVCRDATVGVQLEVAESLTKIHEQAASVLNHSDFQKTSHEGFKRLQETLQQCADLADQSLGTSVSTEVAHHVHHLKKSYTMESEREVFEAAVAESRIAAPVAKGQDRSSRKEEKIVSPTERSRPVVVPVEPAPERDRAVAPRGVEPVPVVTTTEAKPVTESKPELGDNVELF